LPPWPAGCQPAGQPPSIP